VPGRGPPAYNADGGMADSLGPVRRAPDGPLAIADGQPGWQAPATVRRDVNGPVGLQHPTQTPTAFYGPVAHRQMSASNGLVAHRGSVLR